MTTYHTKSKREKFGVILHTRHTILDYLSMKQNSELYDKKAWFGSIVLKGVCICIVLFLVPCLHTFVLLHSMQRSGNEYCKNLNI